MFYASPALNSDNAQIGRPLGDEPKPLSQLFHAEPRYSQPELGEEGAERKPLSPLAQLRRQFLQHD